jgi:hypothetical protein
MVKVTLRNQGMQETNDACSLARDDASVPLAEAIGHLRTVPLDEGFVHATRSLGIRLGD